MGGPASNLLRMREQLELTDEQVKKLETLQSIPRPQRNEADMLRARADLMDATKGDINLEKARAAFDRMARVRTDEQLAQLKSRQELRGVLNPAQRAKLDAMAGRLRDRRGAAMRGRANQRIGPMRAPQFRGQRPGQGRGQFGPGMGNRRGPNGPLMVPRVLSRG
ncbi:MAG: Spy/CpxP family protein refolding chaperone [Gemmatimonadaceae bacterium]|nr:Spy/CpxP family protein refolding chaperone [Gemmatimonadaceae bacterium]